MVAAVRNCYVGFFDVLGFKALRANKGTAGVAQLYERSLLAMVQHAAAGSSVLERRGDHDVLVPQSTELSIDYRVISDSVVFMAKDDSFASFFSIVYASCRLLEAGFGNGQTPFRGAIGHGDLYSNGEITVGSAIEDAYLGETSQLWAGVMFTPSATKQAEVAGHFKEWTRIHEKVAQDLDDDKAVNARKNLQQIIKYDVPLKPQGETYNAYVLDWTLRVFSSASEKALPISTDERSQIIRQNTISFERWARSRELSSLV